LCLSEMQTQALEQEQAYYYECTEGHRFEREHGRQPGCPQHLFKWGEDERGDRVRLTCDADYERVYWECGYDKCDGTYPLDGNGTWEAVRASCGDEKCRGYCATCRGAIDVMEAVKLLDLPLHPADVTPVLNGRRYLFLNKGFVVLASEGRGLHPDRDKRRLSPLLLATLETLDEPHQASGWPVGTRALYVHDGTYYLIEKMK